jgi:hypothetical protein
MHSRIASHILFFVFKMRRNKTEAQQFFLLKTLETFLFFVNIGRASLLTMKMKCNDVACTVYASVNVIGLASFACSNVFARLYWLYQVNPDTRLYNTVQQCDGN